MKFERKFFRCAVCGNIVGLIEDGGGVLICCGQNMNKLIPNTTDGAFEKHIPVGTFENGRLLVTVGSAPHPMIEAHHIMWIAVAAGNTTMRISLNPDEAPSAEFFIKKQPATIYAYCNLHGLWRAEM